RIVNDNDYQPRDLQKAGFPPRWAPEKDVRDAAPDADEESLRLAYRAKRDLAKKDRAWDAEEDNGFRHEPRPRAARASLRYPHLERSAPGAEQNQPQANLIRDFLAYNSGRPALPGTEPPEPNNWVGDLALECEVKVDQAEGELVLELSKGFDRFQARWD